MSEIVERIEEVCGLYFRSVLLPFAGITVPQHAHDHDHATLVCSGKVRVWANGQPLGDFEAGQAVPITAGVAHMFHSLEEMTRLCCVHSIESAESVKEKHPEPYALREVIFK